MTNVAREAGVTLCWQTQVTGLEPKIMRIVGRSVRYKWLIAADGFHSRLRQWAPHGRGVLLITETGAVTGEGMHVAFSQAAELADALVIGDLRSYETAHRRIMRKPRGMAQALLLLDGRDGLRRLAFQGLSTFPIIFSSLLAFHVGTRLTYKLPSIPSAHDPQGLAQMSR